MLWYNSNGAWNDAPQTPRNIMHNSIARDKEMAWLQSIGVKGIKVDFFAGDKQETMKLYEDILYDANRYGIQCIFHGCTIRTHGRKNTFHIRGTKSILKRFHTAKKSDHFSAFKCCDAEAISG
jgi:hypothetical protein